MRNSRVIFRARLSAGRPLGSQCVAIGPWSPHQTCATRLLGFVRALIRLLNDHTYLLHDQKKMVRVIMHNEKDGKVWLNELELRSAI